MPPPPPTFHLWSIRRRLAINLGTMMTNRDRQKRDSVQAGIIHQVRISPVPFFKKRLNVGKTHASLFFLVSFCTGELNGSIPYPRILAVRIITAAAWDSRGARGSSRRRKREIERKGKGRFNRRKLDSSRSRCFSSFFSSFLPIRNPSPLPIFLSAHSSWLGPPYQGTRHEYLQRARIDFPHRRSESKIKVDFPTSNGRFPLGKRSAIKISWPRDKGKTFLPSFHLDCKEGTHPHESFSSLASIPALFLIRLLSLIYAEEEEEGSSRVLRTERSPD